MNKESWCYPVICDAAYFARLRDDYPENAYMDDDGLHEYYNDGRKYSITWDHIGDAYEEYEPLADAFFEQEKRIKELEDQNAGLVAACDSLDADNCSLQETE